jgi:formylglycine-generating enzyme required for sulfatase activity
VKQSICSRADLLQALVGENEGAIDYLADHLGYKWQPSKEITIQTAASAPGAGLGESGQFSGDSTTQALFEHFPDVPFWRVEACEFFTEQDEKSFVTDMAFASAWQPAPEQSHPPLTSWSAALPRIRKHLNHSLASRQIDIKQTVARLSRAEIMADLPLESRRAWGNQVQLILDRSNTMKPYRSDQIGFIREIKRLFPKQAIHYAEYRHGDAAPRLVGKGKSAGRYQVPPPGTLVIAVTDLGLLTSAAEQKHWLQLGRQLTQNQCRPLTLLPTDAPPVDSILGRYWRLIPWCKSQHAITLDVQSQLERLMVLVSPATRIEPGFLRQVRQLMGADAVIEAAFWQHPHLATRSSVAAALDLEVAREKREQFDKEDPQLRAQVLTLLRGWRTHLPPEIWYEEIISLCGDSQKLLPDPNEIAHAQQFFSNLGRRLGRGENITGLAGWFRGLEQRLPDHVWGDEQLKPSFQTLWAGTHQNEADAIPPPGYQPRATAHSQSRPVESYQLFQHGGQLTVVRGELADIANNPTTAGSWLGQLKSRSEELVVEPQTPFWRDATPPEWASDWGEDEYGLWVEFRVKTETGATSQRLRWINPGSFRMGSPEDEWERVKSEGPPHQVSLSEGYWLLDTAVTQALWQAVVEKNPSQFGGAERPVENVTWSDCQAFIQRLNALKPGLNLALPSEAQWEYAFRAGTQTPFSFGRQVNTGQANYDGNSPYHNGEKGEYRQETVEVKHFSPNRWGLYQMHGNVFEWCRDGLRDYQDQAERDPLGPKKGGTYRRVVRGGSWNDLARDLRASFRSDSPPGNRGDGIGFRCARVQAGAEPVEPLRKQSGTRSSATIRKGAAQVMLAEKAVASLADWSQRRDYILRSDLGAIRLRHLTQPDWATAIGRDRFGLWVEIDVEGKYGTARQRLRWIPPGQFLMGSLISEHGSLVENKDEHRWFEREVPQHPVTLSQGYWLFDTPVTQVMWQAVMGDNPSEFHSLRRPVENVSWHDANAFIERINEMNPGLNLCLPTEAQWEYACRAMTQTATYVGELKILGSNNAPQLDEIVWYGGNSGHGYELEKGFDSRAWPEKQYDHSKAGSREVGQKRPNNWGVYDMLGNVWEWCRDGLRTYQAQAEQNPVGSEEEGTSRVVRGGSWGIDARGLRAAFRGDGLPEVRYGDLGFRCSRVQERASTPSS